MTDSEHTAPAARSPRVLREIAIFVALAFGLGWLVYTPFLLSGAGPEDPSYGVSAQLYMFTPAVAALIVVLLVWRPAGRRRALSLAPLRPWRRLAGYCGLALLLPPLIGLAATLAAGLMGIIEFDLTGFSALREFVQENYPAAAEHLSDGGFPAAAWLMTMGLAVGGALLPALVLMLGEELGWRGYLLPRLLPWGVWTALLGSGLVWALWHSPQLFVLVSSGSWSTGQVLVFITAVTVLGVVVGWVRLASGTVWPAVVMHGANNVYGVTAFGTLTHVDSPTDPILYSGGTGGVVGIGVALVVVAALALSGRLRVRPVDREALTTRPARPARPGG